ncbi:unnamed protein product, partial [Adineta ricciae]
APVTNPGEVTPGITTTTVKSSASIKTGTMAVVCILIMPILQLIQAH